MNRDPTSPTMPKGKISTESIEVRCSIEMKPAVKRYNRHHELDSDGVMATIAIME
jgi:hypothetical protein